MQRVVLSILFLIMISPAVYATGQESDRLIYNGKIYELFSNPLEDYYPTEDKKPKFMVEPHVMRTSNLRGYIATWEIEADKLYLRNIDSWLCDDDSRHPGNEGCHKVTLGELFAEKFIEGKVEASWFSGELRVPDGKLLQYVHMGFGSMYERDIVFEVTKGAISKQRVIDNTKRARPSAEKLEKQELEKLRKSPNGDQPVFSKPNI